ncbi:NPCBM/NEW2 domain-containing protein [Deinococcus aquatilis]|uniref:NPCBM/NEW2 domain-containing protein n=1 Tax=Deinococcus aquatilis TaxID=519440 RepID=UPI00039AC8E3|nr:NPCBM/NEW2 domain-containing protein [Deinococcus aquatilis]
MSAVLPPLSGRLDAGQGEAVCSRSFPVRIRSVQHSLLAFTTLALTLASCASVSAPTNTDAVSGVQASGSGSLTAQSLPSPSSQPLAPQQLLSATSGWGPVEYDLSNGEQAAADGRTLSLGGQTYGRGYGVHAPSSLVFSVGEQCQTFSADVGVDDEVSGGSVTFQVWADGQLLADSGLLRGTDAARRLTANVAGKKQLKLVVTSAGDGPSQDHADWAAPTLQGCAPVAVSSTESKEVFGGPLVITRGGTYSGNWESLDSSVPAVRIRTSEPVVIENSLIRGRGTLIQGFHTRLTVRNTRGTSLNPEFAGRSPGRFANLEEVYDVHLENNLLEGTGGIYVRHYLGNAALGETITVVKNVVKNIDGRQSNGNGGYSDKAFNWAQFVQLNDVTRIAGAEIAWNQVVNEPGKSRVEDNINLFVSSGTPNSPIKIHDNYIQGAYNAAPATDDKFSGGGILIGDGKVSDPTRNGYAHVYRNQVVSTTNYGIAIAGGMGSLLENNRVLSSGRLPDGSPVPAQNVGMYLWDAQRGSALSPSTFGNNIVRYNTIGWTRVRGNVVDGNPYWWPAKGLNGSTTISTTVLGTSVTLETERQEFQRWQDKLAQAGIRIGTQ